MIDLLIIIILIVTIIFFQLILMPEMIKILINLILLCSFLFYIGANISDVNISIVFMILSVICILLIPILIIINYIEKIIE